MAYRDLPRYQRVAGHLEADGRSLAIITALTDAALEARAAVLDTADQTHIATATWGLAWWEELVGITPAADATLADRRAAVTAKLLGSGTCNTDMIARLAKAVTGYDTLIVEQYGIYSFSLTFVGDEPGLVSVDREGLIAAVEEVKPAHLEFIINGITWSDFHFVGMTWAALHAMEATWDDIHNKVMVQPRG